MWGLKPLNIMKKIFVIGVGSILCGDDGVGPRVIDALKKEKLPENITVYSGDLSGLDLLKFFPDYDEVIIVDAADMKLEPGQVRIFKPKDIKKADFNDKFSTHGMALLETLTLASELEMASDITIVGVQPEDTSFNLDMTETIKLKIPEIVKVVKKIIS